MESLSFTVQSGRARRTNSTFLRVPLGRKFAWLAVAWLACGNLAHAQQKPAASGFQAYSLKLVNAADAKRDLAKLFQSWNEKVEIMVDPDTNRLLVNGSPEAQKKVQSVVDAMDRPGQAPTQGSSSVKYYQFPNQDVEQIAAEWQKRFPVNSGVKVVADARQSQIIVIAPDEVHALLGAKSAPAAGQSNNVSSLLPLPKFTAPGAKSTDGPTAIAAVSLKPTLGEVIQRKITLTNARWEFVEQKIQELWGSKLPKANLEPNDKRVVLVFDAGDGHKWSIETDAERKTVTVQGPSTLVKGWTKIIESLDEKSSVKGQVTKLVAYQKAQRDTVKKAADAIMSSKKVPAGDAQSAVRSALFATIMKTKAPQRLAQNGDPNPAQPAIPPSDNPDPPTAPPGDPNAIAREDSNPFSGAPFTQVRLDFVEGLDLVIITGPPAEVARMKALLEEIEKIAKDTTPEVQIYPLQNVSGESVGPLLQSIMQTIYTPRQGSVSITPLGKPNALLMIGRKENVVAAIDLLKKLDVPVPPATQFKVFPLKHVAVTQAELTINNFFAARPFGGVRAIVASDVRSNTMFIQAAPRDMQELEAFIKSLDVQTSGSENEVRTFPLSHTSALDMAALLQEAITGQITQRRTTGGQQNPLQQFQQQQPQQNQGANQQNQAQARSAMLKFLMIDNKGEKTYRSGILNDVKVLAEPRSNSLIVTAPTESMDLIGALIRQLDNMPAVESQIKVFTIVNGDATNLTSLLESLFGQQQQQRQGQGNNNQNFQVTPFGLINVGGAGGGEGESTLVPLRFSVDTRTNSIVVSGTTGDLNVVEAILLRLDEGDVRHRRTTVYRLKNAPAADVANAINQYLTTERQVQQIGNFTGATEQIQREVVVVPELVNNSLIISATAAFYEEIKKLVQQLDERPPMVMIQVLIAEVTLNSTDEFGVELGFQDNALFDRSLLGGLVTTNTTQTLLNGTSVQTQDVLAATNEPGFNFNTANPLGNSGSTNALSTRNTVASQGLTNFSVGRTNNQLGFGGLVLSASSDSVSFLMRALHECRRLDVLSRPQIMTLDNQPAFIQVGQRVPRITGVNITTTGQVNTVTLENVGLILGVTPRISPDGLVVMEIDAEKSQLGPEAEGIPINITATGQVVRSPRIDTTLAQTTVSALSGQTVVLGGLITKSRSEVHRRVPLLSEIPLLGNLFRYDNVGGLRTELLIIMTPRIVRNEHDAEVIKKTEAGRMSWCLADVIKLNGEAGLRSRKDEWSDGETCVVYPDLMPTAPGVDRIPVPGEMRPGMPTGPAMNPPRGSSTLPAPLNPNVNPNNTVPKNPPAKPLPGEGVIQPSETTQSAGPGQFRSVAKLPGEGGNTQLIPPPAAGVRLNQPDSEPFPTLRAPAAANEPKRAPETPWSAQTDQAASSRRNPNDRVEPARFETPASSEKPAWFR